MTDQQRWRDLKISAPRVAVNVSPLQLRKSDFGDFVSALVQTFAGCKLELEVTESVLMQELNSSISVLRQIRDQGVTVAVDDFGTGYSSLADIAKLPITALKIGSWTIPDRQPPSQNVHSDPPLLLSVTRRDRLLAGNLNVR